MHSQKVFLGLSSSSFQSRQSTGERSRGPQAAGQQRQISYDTAGQISTKSSRITDHALEGWVVLVLGSGGLLGDAGGVIGVFVAVD